MLKHCSFQVYTIPRVCSNIPSIAEKLVHIDWSIGISHSFISTENMAILCLHLLPEIWIEPPFFLLTAARP